MGERISGSQGAEVTMTRPHLRDIPPVDFPPGFVMRPVTPANISAWTTVQRAAEEFGDISDDLFRREFGRDEAEIARRCFLLYDQTEAVGTVSAWHSRDRKERNTHDGKDAGRIHWVAIHPSCQGKGLGKAILSFALEQLAAWHSQVWLATSTARIPAVRMYLNYGFMPDLPTPEARAAWRDFQTHSPHPALAALDL